MISMKIFWTYFLLEWKKSIKTLWKSILGLILLILFLIVGVAAVSLYLLQSQAFKRVQVAVVIPKEEKLVKQAAGFAAAMESVESVCQLYYYSKEQAWQKLKEGSVDAIILIPDHFYEDVYTGVNTPATLYLPSDSSLNTKIFSELLAQAVSLLQNAQAGVYAALAVARQQETKLDEAVLGDYLAKEYALELLKRDKLFENEILSVTGQLSAKQYYFVTALLLVLLTSGLLFGFLYKPQNRAVEDKLIMYGLEKRRLALVKIFTMTAVLWMLSMLIYVSSCLILHFTAENWLPLRWRGLVGLGLISFALSAYFHLLFSLGGKTMQSVVILLGANLLLILSCGLLLPAAYFPEWLERVGRILPLTHWKDYLQNLIFAQNTAGQGFLVLVGALITTGLGAFAYEKIH